MVNWPTLIGSFIVSLVAAYIGVRYFTAPRLRAENAHEARRAIRDFTSPLIRDIREFRQGVRNNLARDHTTQTDDAILAIELRRLSIDLPPLARRSFTK
jgi:hypothetical protein